MNVVRSIFNPYHIVILHHISVDWSTFSFYKGIGQSKTPVVTPVNDQLIFYERIASLICHPNPPPTGARPRQPVR